MPNIGGSSGTSPEYSPRVVLGSRKILYSNREEQVMMSRDSFDTIETQIRDRNRFMNFAICIFGVAGSLILDRGLDFYLKQETDNAVIIMFFSVLLLVFGIIFFFLSKGKNREYITAKKKLFNQTNIISDETIIKTSDGSEIIHDHLADNGSSRVKP